jgi:hypothetical protein
LFVLIAQQAGQAVVPGRLSLLCASLMMTLAFRPTCDYFMSAGKSEQYAVNSLRFIMRKGWEAAFLLYIIPGKNKAIIRIGSPCVLSAE